jgi:hypothetical protein
MDTFCSRERLFLYKLPFDVRGAACARAALSTDFPRTLAPPADSCDAGPRSLDILELAGSVSVEEDEDPVYLAAALPTDPDSP